MPKHPPDTSALDSQGFVRADSQARCGQCAYSLAGLSAKGTCPECGLEVRKSLGLVSELDSAGNVPLESTRLCMRCGYALKGLPGTGSCPECGTAVALSLRERRLHNCSLEYIKTIRSGLSLVLNGILLTLILIIGGVGIGFAAAAGLGTIVPPSLLPAQLLAVAVILLSLGLSIMIAVGYLRFATPDPSEVESDSTRRSRKTLRLAVIVQLVLSGFQFIAGLFPIISVNFGLSMQVLEGLSQLIWLLALLVQVICMMRYTRWLGSRVPDQWIVKRTKLYVWLLPVISIAGCMLLGIGPLIALILYWNLLDRLRKHLKAIEAGGTHMAFKGAGLG